MRPSRSYQRSAEAGWPGGGNEGLVQTAQSGEGTLSASYPVNEGLLEQGKAADVGPAGDHSTDGRVDPLVSISEQGTGGRPYHCVPPARDVDASDRRLDPRMHRLERTQHVGAPFLEAPREQGLTGLCWIADEGLVERQHRTRPSPIHPRLLVVGDHVSEVVGTHGDV